MDPLLEKKYIPTKKASELSKYNSDYIARLCKSGKIVGRQVGRSWLVEESSLRQFCALQEMLNKQRAETLSKVRVDEYKSATTPEPVVVAETENTLNLVAKSDVPISYARPTRRAEPVRSWFSFGSHARESALAVAGAFLVLSMSLGIGQMNLLAKGIELAVGGIRSGGEEVEHIALSAIDAAQARDFRYEYERIGITFLKVLETNLAFYNEALLAAADEAQIAQNSFARTVGSVSDITYAITRVQNSMLVSYLLSIERAGESTLALSEVTRDARMLEQLPNIPDAIEKTQIAFGSALISGTEGVLSLHRNGAYAWVETSQQIPQRAIAVIHGIGDTIETYAVGMPRAISRGYETSVYAVAEPITEVASDTLALLQGSGGRELTVSEPMSVVATASLSGTDFSLLNLARLSALKTYVAVENFFDRTTDTLASLFVQPTSVVIVPHTPALPSTTTQSGPLPNSSYSMASGTIIQNVTNYFTTTGVSYAYLEQRLRETRASLLDRPGLIRASNRANTSTSVDLTSISGSSITNSTFEGASVDTDTLTIGTLNGPLQANNGVVSATSSIGVLYGGTGLGSLPTYGQLLVGDGTGGYNLIATSSLGISAGSGTPGGADTQVQFNSTGTFAGDAGFTYNATADRVTVVNASTTALTVSGAAYFPGSGVWNSSGNVGIGVSAPTERLQVNGVVRVGTADDAGMINLGDILSGSGNYTNGIFRGGLGTTAGGSYLNLGAWDGIAFNTSGTWLGSQTTRMIISGATGNVGIGTTTPDARLSIVSMPGTSVGDLVASFTSNDTWQSGFSVVNTSISGNAQWQFMVGGSTNDATGVDKGNFGFYNSLTHHFPLILASSTDDVLLARDAGNVGIGTSSPWRTLSVNGSSDLGINALAGSFTGSDTATSTLVGGIDTERIKTSATSTFAGVQIASGGLSLGSLSGFLKATAGTVSTALIDLANDVGASILAVANGGTGWANLQANTVLLGNGTGRVATTSAGTNGQVLALVSGVPTWVATSTLSTISGTLAVGSGGTGATSFINNRLLTGNGTSAIVDEPNLTFDGSLLTVTGNASTTQLTTTGSTYLATTGGNVGIGTTSPSSKLSLDGGNNSFGGFTIAGATTGYSLARIYNTGADLMWGVSDSGGTTVTSNLANASLFGSRNATALQLVTNNTARVTIDSSGNVGIGTTTPGTKLDIGAGNIQISSSGNITSTDQSVLYKPGFTASSAITSDFKVGLLNLNGHGAYTLYGTESTSDTSGNTDTHIAFYTIDAGVTGTVERMRINYDGNVGIGTTTPPQLLTVVSGTSDGSFLSGTDAIYATKAGATSISVRDSASDVQLSAYVDGSGGVFGSMTNHKLFLRTNNTNGLTIDTSQNVGIGTAAPTAKLSIGTTGVNALPTNTQVWITGAGGTHASNLQGRISIGVDANQDYGAFIGAINPDGLTAVTVIGERHAGVDYPSIAIRGTTGNVGIGTTSPLATLNVNATTAGYSSGTGNIVITNSSDTRQRLGFGYDTALGTDGSGWIQPLRANVAYTPLLLNPNGGNVGIGTTSPQARLHVANPGTASQVIIGDRTNAGGWADLLLQTNTGTYNWRIAAQNIINNGFEITPSTATGGNTFSNPAISIAGATGYVGLANNTAPGAELHIGSGSGISYTIKMGNTYAGGIRTTHNSGVGQRLELGTYDNSSTFTPALYVQGNGTGGRIGISDDSPDYKFESVGSSGSGYFAITNSSDGDIFNIGSGGDSNFGGTIFASFGSASTYAMCSEGQSSGIIGVSGFGSNSCISSTIRAKENVVKLAGGQALEILNQLRVVSFDYKDQYREENETGESYGLIAEEVELIDSRLVDYGGDGLPASLHFERITGLTVQAIQELNLNLATIASTTATSSPASENFADAFFSNVFSRLTAWFEDTGNGIGNLMAGALYARDQICVDDQCLTKDDVRALLEVVHGSQGGGGEDEQPPVEEPPVEDQEPPEEDTDGEEGAPPEDSPEETAPDDPTDSGTTGNSNGEEPNI